MIKKSVCIVLMIFLSFPLSGCWSYRGLKQIAIVAGLAIDKDTVSGDYKLTFEMVDLSGKPNENGMKSKIVESQGKTIFDAIRNAKKRLLNKLYFGDTEIVVISSKIAREDGINSFIDLFLRDTQLRETVYFVISQADTAEEIITQKGIENAIVSYEMAKIIDEDSHISASTKCIPSYKVFNVLQSKGISLVLPAFHCIPNNKENSVEANGIAVFKKDKLLGYLSAEDTRYYLFAVDDVAGGILTCDLGSGPHDIISLEITSNKTKISHSYEKNKIKINITTKTKVSLGEINSKMDVSNEQELNEIKTAAEKTLKQKITQVIYNVQSQFGSDIFGFGNTIYKTDTKLWNQIGANWDSIFLSAEFEVSPEIEIVNTGVLKSN